MLETHCIQHRYALNGNLFSISEVPNQDLSKCQAEMDKPTFNASITTIFKCILDQTLFLDDAPFVRIRVCLFSCLCII